MSKSVSACPVRGRTVCFRFVTVQFGKPVDVIFRYTSDSVAATAVNSRVYLAQIYYVGLQNNQLNRDFGVVHRVQRLPVYEHNTHASERILDA